MTEKERDELHLKGQYCGKRYCIFCFYIYLARNPKAAAEYHRLETELLEAIKKEAGDE